MIHHKSNYKIKPLSECSKNEIDDSGISEHDLVIALMHLPDEFNSEQLADEVAKAVAERYLIGLVDKGKAMLCWDEASQSFHYKPTEEGMKFLDGEES